MDYREATPGDVESLADFCWSLQNYESGIDDLLDVSEKARELIHERMKDKLGRSEYKFFVAEEGKEIVGYTFGVVEEKDPRYRVREMGYICELYVKEDYRGERVASELVKLLLNWFRGNGIEYVKTDVYSRNELGCSFWKEVGFEDYTKGLIKNMG